jgi:phosphoglycolate phosphatase-like HAD superfamily hydrolase
LQSNKLKSVAFEKVLSQYDPKIVREFVKWHKKNGGISRYEKFTNFFKERLGVKDWQTRTNAACTDFGKVVFGGLCECPFIPGSDCFLAHLKTQNIPLAVNTGGAEDEIREVFRIRGLLDNFETLLGSPTTKYDNMIKLYEMGLLRPGTKYFGDSKLDFELSRDFELDFVYVRYESEWLEGELITTKAGGQIIMDYYSFLD